MKEKLARARLKRYKMHEESFSEAREILGEEAVYELRKLYEIYDEKFYIWLAQLWDPEIGGFYFSNSARDSHGFLPDIESTMQALRCIESMGLTKGKPFVEAISPEMKAALSRFVKGLQDENGYFYHPQWGRNIVTPRRGRDLSWSLQLLEHLGEKPNYPSPLEKSENGKKSVSLPEHLQTIEAFKKYLSEFNLAERSYWICNMLQSQTMQIKAAGEEFVEYMFDWLSKNQREDNGLWQEVVNYDSVNGLMKASLMYSALGRPLPRADRALISAIQAALSDEEIVFCCQFYNPLSAASHIFYNIGKFGNREKLEELREIVRENAPSLIRRTREKVLNCKREDGSFSYNPKTGCPVSQRAPVAQRGVLEGDVNGASICLNGVMSNLSGTLGIKKVPVFSDVDSDLFFYILNNVENSEKTHPKPEWFDDYLVEEGTAW